MLIWDTGEYTVLPGHDTPRDSGTETDDTDDDMETGKPEPSEITKLCEGFQNRKLRLRLDGTRLPSGYTILLRMSSENFRSEQPKRPSRRRRQKIPKPETPQYASSDSETPLTNATVSRHRHIESIHRTASPSINSRDPNGEEQVAPYEESELVRLTNASPGATNSVRSVHQRKWYLSMDRKASGFSLVRDHDTGAKKWARRRRSDGSLAGFEGFGVLGRDSERSMVTGRLAKDILEDEKVEGYVPRCFWRPVTE